MRAIIFTSNSIRHKFLANKLSENLDDSLIISECKNDFLINSKINDINHLIADHFNQRQETEKSLFSGNDFFINKTLPILKGEVNSEYVQSIVKKFKPDIAFVFGASVIKTQLLSLIPNGHFLNLHLGLSPYYRGSGTNFWPFVNKELEYVGSTLLHIDEGIDTGDIIAHVRPNIAINDNIHTIGCKVIKNSASIIIKQIDSIKAGGTLKRVKQWKSDKERYYKKSDFNEEALNKALKNMENGLIENYVNSSKRRIKLIKP